MSGKYSNDYFLPLCADVFSLCTFVPTLGDSMEVAHIVQMLVQLLLLGCAMVSIYYLTGRQPKTPEGIFASSAGLILGGAFFMAMYG